MDLGLLARALRDRQIDLAAGNATDGLITALDLFVLEDDKHYFPPYEAVPVIREQTLREHPEVGPALAELAGKISDDAMRRMNYVVDGQHRDAKEVVQEFLRSQRPDAYSDRGQGDPYAAGETEFTMCWKAPVKNRSAYSWRSWLSKTRTERWSRERGSRGAAEGA